MSTKFYDGEVRTGIIDDTRLVIAKDLECRKCSVKHSMFSATCDFYNDEKTGIPLSIWRGEKKCPHFKER